MTSTNNVSSQPMERVLYEVKKVIVGQDHLLERMVVALLSKGHILVEGVPGLAKTMAVKTLSRAIGGEFQRIQFTPDLLPADLIGTRSLQPADGRVQHRKRPRLYEPPVGRRDQPRPGQGPKRPARGNAGAAGHHRPRESYPVPKPFLVMATQKPDRSRGHLSIARGPG